jgi:hypothetical protein
MISQRCPNQVDAEFLILLTSASRAGLSVNDFGTDFNFRFRARLIAPRPVTKVVNTIWNHYFNSGQPENYNVYLMCYFNDYQPSDNSLNFLKHWN